MSRPDRPQTAPLGGWPPGSSAPSSSTGSAQNPVTRTPCLCALTTMALVLWPPMSIATPLVAMRLLPFADQFGEPRFAGLLERVGHLRQQLLAPAGARGVERMQPRRRLVAHRGERLRVL